jgi:RNA polymerase sigma factor (sigma-70 family)
MCYEAEMPGLLRSLMRTGARQEDIADAAQLAFEVLLREWNNVQHPGPWLRTVAFRKLLRELERREDPLNEDEDSHASKISLPFVARIELHDEEQRVLSIIRRLPPTQRAVFALHYDHLTYKEIAGILRMEEPAVRQNLARARATLKKILSPE